MTVEPDDHALMLRFRAGDTVAFQRLYERHKAALYHHLLGRSSEPGVAGDVFEDCWLRVIAVRLSYEPTAPFAEYLFAVANDRVAGLPRASRRDSAENGNATSTPVEQVPGQVDARILAAARERSKILPPQRASRRWLIAVAVAATLLLVVAVILRVAIRPSGPLLPEQSPLPDTVGEPGMPADTPAAVPLRELRPSAAPSTTVADDPPETPGSVAPAPREILPAPRPDAGGLVDIGRPVLEQPPILDSAEKGDTDAGTNTREP